MCTPTEFLEWAVRPMRALEGDRLPIRWALLKFVSFNLLRKLNKMTCVAVWRQYCLQAACLHWIHLPLGGFMPPGTAALEKRTISLHLV